MEQYKIKMDNFEGPLDLLCYLIDKNKIDICDIKICEITDQYLEYLKKMKEMNLDVTSEFIVMAAKLIYLKSKSLLPSIVEEVEETEVDFIKMLLEYKVYKEYTYQLKERLEEYSKRFYKTPDLIDFPKERLIKEYETNLIPQIYNAFVAKEIAKKNTQAENINRLALSEKVTIRSKIKEILKELWKKPTFIFNKMFNIKSKDKVEIVTAFMSLLELSKLNRIELRQDKLFGDICVSKINRQR